MFPEYHRLMGCQTLRATVEDLNNLHNVRNNVYDNYCRYHFSVVNKLQFAFKNFKELVSIVSDPNAGLNAISNPREFLFPVNYCLDSFLHFCVSATDIFARDVLCYFDLIPLGRNIYFKTAFEILSSRNSGNMLLPRLIPPDWLEVLREYRNWSTHEEVVTDTIGVTASVIGPNNRNVVALQIPDAPHIYPKAYNRKIVMIGYCNKTLKRILNIFNQTYYEIDDLIQDHGNLPIPP